MVLDASVIVAALVDSGPEGTWAQQLIGSEDRAAPYLLLVAANILRRAALAGDISRDSASLAHADLLSVPGELFGLRAVSLSRMAASCECHGL